MDFTDVNKAFPKDPYPLPRIDQIVDSTAGYNLLCFLDAFSGYHQIKMAKEDKEKTAYEIMSGDWSSDVSLTISSDMPGVPREVIEHHLAVCPGARPVMQEARR